MSDKQIQVTVKPYGATRGAVQTQIANALRDAGIPIIGGFGTQVKVMAGHISTFVERDNGEITFCWNPA